MVRRKVLLYRQLNSLHRTWELQLSCGHRREYHMLNAPIPKTTQCSRCTLAASQSDAAVKPCEMCGDAPCRGCNKCCGSKLGRDPEDGSCLGCG